ncbi:MAG: hypothetical protein IJ953_07740 [Campylobacter sp.]|nr:hypothetical protein [Campylobacter sp.]
MNKHSELEILKLCERLAELLSDKEAIADLKYLYYFIKYYKRTLKR